MRLFNFCNITVIVCLQKRKSSTNDVFPFSDAYLLPLNCFIHHQQLVDGKNKMRNRFCLLLKRRVFQVFKQTWQCICISQILEGTNAQVLFSAPAPGTFIFPLHFLYIVFLAMSVRHLQIMELYLPKAPFDLFYVGFLLWRHKYIGISADKFA